MLWASIIALSSRVNLVIPLSRSAISIRSRCDTHAENTTLLIGRSYPWLFSALSSSHQRFGQSPCPNWQSRNSGDGLVLSGIC
ncbi:hypothetical protein BO78DRAFT_93740 [Aspergillus sclerotiicarbonarius CBS 121057]|uniref:Uncharacterized protein n=1 Tax=Aspergillus sclerotiicarbonarius (strain CBS 121057 / IBT 28362) TaxID=1448318 RepID=A0A319FIJ1_ASPSB|nr:hypothetical protein BO78DRAFT_93740 [Aspergillus sclerotiicarbonarius CBS 121057]